jgi:hypothetical protein
MEPAEFFRGTAAGFFCLLLIPARFGGGNHRKGE